MRIGAKAVRQLWAILAIAAVTLLLSLFILRSDYYQLVLTYVLLWAVLSLAWNILSGYAGYFSFGHAVFWGLGSYTVALGLLWFHLTPWLSIPLSAVVGAAAGALIGYPTFRLRGHYFALAMLAYPLATLYVFQWLGYQELALPMERTAPALYMQFADRRVYVVLALALLVIALLISLWVENTRFGMALTAIKQNEPAAEAAGINTWRWKMLALMLSGALASVAGAFYGVVMLVVTPESVFGMLVSAQALILALFGGVGSLWGPVIGAAVLVPLAEGLNAELGTILPGIQGVVYGVAIIAIILLAPEGVYWRVRDRMSRRRGRGGARTAVPRAAVSVPDLAEAGAAVLPLPHMQMTQGRDLLVLRDVGIAFGGLRALDGIDLVVPEGGLYGIIGPNGAGKTTLFNVINGFLAPDRGTIQFAGEPITGLRPNRVCRRGIGRTFQVVRAFPRMTVLENVIVGAFVGARDDATARRMALAALDRVGLSGAAEALAGGLTTRELRLMELARALVPHPKLILLDETLAGLGHEDLGGILDVIRQVRADGTTVLIIEHTMQAMVQLVDHFTVLDHGRLIASGRPDAVVRDPNVIEAYLGRKWVNRIAVPAK
jgi:ABC-type branched-subunit amino acid transport system ATPase component/ABC-type branched-subunit amino acid transport system permease subunit